MPLGSLFFGCFGIPLFISSHVLCLCDMMLFCSSMLNFVIFYLLCTDYGFLLPGQQEASIRHLTFIAVYSQSLPTYVHVHSKAPRFYLHPPSLYYSCHDLHLSCIPICKWLTHRCYIRLLGIQLFTIYHLPVRFILPGFPVAHLCPFVWALCSPFNLS